MKLYHPNLNKKSRITRDPVAVSPVNELTALDPKQLKFQIAAALRIQNDYYPCFDWAFPPPITQKTPGSPAPQTLFQHPSVVPGRYSVYLHTPFCQSLCKFCYYPVIPGQQTGEMERYVEYLTREMALYAPELANDRCESVYVGGGTPTYLTPALLEKLLTNIHRHFRLTDDAEVTIESAPGTIPRDKIALLKEFGVNRLSYGIQTLDSALLATLNRNYSVAAAVRELEDAVALIGNVNIDTMYGFDGESDDALHKTLATFVALGIPGVSIYALDGQRRNREIVRFEPSKDPHYERKIRIFRDARAFLTGQGFDPVLQNIFLQPTRASYRHQLRRWENVTLVALGMSSMGYAPRRIYQNHLSLKNYYAHIDQGKLPILESEEISQEIEIMREAVCQLRFTQVDLARLNEKYGVNLGAVFHDLIEALTELGYLQSEGRVLRLTDKAAPYNNIIPMLFAPDTLKAVIFGLPEEYRENFPLPHVLTQVGATQSAAMNPGGR